MDGCRGVPARDGRGRRRSSCASCAVRAGPRAAPRPRARWSRPMPAAVPPRAVSVPVCRSRRQGDSRRGDRARRSRPRSAGRPRAAARRSIAAARRAPDPVLRVRRRRASSSCSSRSSGTASRASRRSTCRRAAVRGSRSAVRSGSDGSRTRMRRSGVTSGSATADRGPRTAVRLSDLRQRCVVPLTSIDRTGPFNGRVRSTIRSLTGTMRSSRRRRPRRGSRP